MAYAEIRKILVVDGDEGERAALRGHLEHHGYVVETAVDAVGAIRTGLILEPHVVIGDVHLAEHTTADQVFSALRRHLPDVVSVLVTAESDNTLLARYRALGVSAIFEKPLRREGLDEFLTHLFTERARHDEEESA